MANYMKQALLSLGYTIADLRDSDRAAEIRAEAKRLEASAKASGSGGTSVRQRDVAACLETFEGFADNPDIYGPGVGEITDALSESFPGVKRNTVAQHLAKLRASGFIGSARKLETSGRRGAPPVFYFRTATDEEWSRILTGALVAKG